jgi:hypothetical protein
VGRQSDGLRVELTIARNSFGGGKQQNYDPKKGAWDFLSKKFNLPLTSGEESNAGQPAPAANETQGGQQNEGSGAETEASVGSGRIVINGEPRAESHGFCELREVRRGVDGLWKIMPLVKKKEKWFPFARCLKRRLRALD